MLIVDRHLAELKLRNLSPATRRQRSYALLALSRYLEPVHLLSATPDLLDSWQHSLHTAPTSRRCSVSHVVQFYHWALRQHLIDADPSTVLLLPKVGRRLPRPIGENDLDMAIVLADPQVRAWLELAAFAGLRAGEIARLDRGDILDTAQPPVICLLGKGDRQRVVPLAPRVLDALTAYGLPSHGYVFGRHDGAPGSISPQALSKAANAYLHALGITNTLHSLRHRFGTRTYAACQDLRVVQELMGHINPISTTGYVAYSASSAVEAVMAAATLGRGQREPAGEGCGEAEPGPRPDPAVIEENLFGEYGPATPCPDWCDAAGGHLWDQEVATGRPVRIHSTLVGESVEVICDERAGDPVSQPLIWVSSAVRDGLSPDTGRRLAAALVSAADLVDAMTPPS